MRTERKQKQQRKAQKQYIKTCTTQGQGHWVKHHQDMNNKSYQILSK